jgi:hypothetical protein
VNVAVDECQDDDCYVPDIDIDKFLVRSNLQPNDGLNEITSIESINAA